MKIATWNVNSLAVRLPQLLDWLRLHQPDAVCLQETKLDDAKFIAGLALAAGRQRLSRAYRLELDANPGGAAHRRTNSST